MEKRSEEWSAPAGDRKKTMRYAQLLVDPELKRWYNNVRRSPITLSYGLILPW
jgi:hypothetical protein